MFTKYIQLILAKICHFMLPVSYARTSTRGAFTTSRDISLDIAHYYAYELDFFNYIDDFSTMILPRRKQIYATPHTKSKCAATRRLT